MSATAAPDGKDEGAAIKVQLPTTDQKDQPTGYPAPPETTHPEFPAAKTALKEARAQKTHRRRRLHPRMTWRSQAKTEMQ